MLTLGDVLAPMPGVVSRESDGELVVVIPEEGKFVVLNPTGAEVFRLIDGQRTLEQVATEISGQHEVPLERVRSDVLALAEKLVGRGAVHKPGGGE